MPLEVLLVEDEPTLRMTVGDALEEDGHQVTRLADGAQAASWLASNRADLLLTDVRLPGADGHKLARQALACRPPTAVILMTAYGNVGKAVEMLKLGAHDYLTKPFDEDDLLRSVAEVERSLGSRTQENGEEPTSRSRPMQRLLAMVDRVAKSNTTVLLVGETGSGKEVVARCLHHRSAQAEGPFVAGNCGAIPNDLIESELFGHTRGAFTGAVSARKGWIRSAAGGTLLLDEVSELSASAQASLLRAIESRQVKPVGSDVDCDVDFRLVAATNVDLSVLVEEGRFRADLFYRLNTFELRLPPLRERGDDLAPLCDAFLADLRVRTDEVPAGMSLEAMAALASYPWPGNVRELRNVIEYAAVLAGTETVQPWHLPKSVVGDSEESSTMDLKETLRRAQAEQVRRALSIAGGRKGRAAELLGISRKHLWTLMNREG